MSCFNNNCASAINSQLKWWINLSQSWHLICCKGRCCCARPGWWGKKYPCNHVDISFQQTHIVLGGFFLGVPHPLNRREQCIAHSFWHRLTVGKQRCWTAFDFRNYFAWPNKGNNNIVNDGQLGMSCLKAINACIRVWQFFPSFCPGQ